MLRDYTDCQLAEKYGARAGGVGESQEGVDMSVLGDQCLKSAAKWI